MTPEQFEVMAAVIFDYYFTDEINVMLRKMLTIEQYRNAEIAKLFREISFEGAIEYQTKLFGALIEAKCFRQTDPYMMALEFNSSIFLIFYKFDNNEESLKDARDLFLRHVRHFNENYKV